jgi:hypothetical protein
LRRAFGIDGQEPQRLICINAGSAGCATLVQPPTLAGLRPLLKGRVNVQVSDLYSWKNRAEAATHCGSASVLLAALT